MEPEELDEIEHDLTEAEQILERLDDGSFWTDDTSPVETPSQAPPRNDDGD